MQYITFGKCGFEVSRFGLGTMRLPLTEGGTNADIDEPKAIEMIRYAVDNGVNYFDTAHFYHQFQSKYLLGKALSGGYREKVKVASKIPANRIEKYEDFEALWDEHLAALQTDCIDFCLLHGIDREYWEKFKALGFERFYQEAIAKGKLKYPAFSFHGDLDTYKEIIDSYDWKMSQIQLNIMDVNWQAGLEGLRYAAAKGIAVVIMEPLKGGRLAGNLPADVLAKWNESPVKRSPQEWAFRWLGSLPEVTVVISGSSSLAQLKDSIEIFSKPDFGAITPAEEKLIAEVRERYQVKTAVGCTACEYCLPCPQSVNIPGMFSKWNDACMYDRLPQNMKAYQKQVENGAGADKCVECGACEAACPQKLPIIEKLKEAVKVLA